MKSIYLYSPHWCNMGGGERYMLYLASALSKLPDVHVTLLSGFPEITKEKLQEFFSVNLSEISYEIVRDAMHSLRKLVGSSDIFVPQSNFKKIKVKSKTYVQALQIPYGKITILTIAGKILRGKLKEAIKDILRSHLLSYTKRCSSCALTYSQFVHDTLLRNFGLESEVLYPPIQDFLVAGAMKRKTILSVGRFFRGLYNDKRYDVLTEAFRMLSKDMPGWEYHLVGSASSDKQTQELIQNLRTSNVGFPIYFHINESHESVKKFYNEALILWHGAGYGVDEIQYPERTEHFGMSVGEAMSARCVPIVVNKGGLKEIVHHGVNGFLWEDIDALIKNTLFVANLQASQLSEMQENAREGFQDFSVVNFENRVAELFLPFLQ